MPLRPSNNPHPPFDVFGFGHCCIDYLLVLDPYPDKGKKGEVVESLIIGGGPIPTALQCLARFGKTTRFCGKVGDDPDGRQIIAELTSSGVDCDLMIVDPEVKTARAYISIDPHSGIRTVALDVRRFNWIRSEQFDPKLAADCRIFFTDGRAFEASLQGLKTAREAGVTTVFDSGSVRPGFYQMLPFIDYVVVSRDLAETFRPGVSPRLLAQMLVEKGAGCGIVTDGENGAYSFDSKQERHHPGYHVEVYDSTGAGDVFHGAFIYGLLEEWEFERAIDFANAAAALSCRKLSGRKGIPSLDDVSRFISNR